MKKFAGAAGPSVTLVVALVVLLTSLAALLLANSLLGQLREAQGQLEEAQGQLQDSQSELQKTKDRQQMIQSAKDRQQKTAKEAAGPAGSQPSTVNNSQPQDNTKERSQNDTEDSTREGREEQGQQVATLALIQGDGGYSLPYLLLAALGLAVAASLALVVISALTLLSGSRPGRSEAGSEASTPSHVGTSNLESPSEDQQGNPLEDGRWMKLVEECVEVVDELDEHVDSFDAPRREVAGHVILRLEEILGRSGVQIISNEAIFDRTRHKPDEDHGATDNGAAVRETLSPGFAVGPRVLRRARVRLERKEVDPSRTSR